MVFCYGFKLLWLPLYSNSFGVLFGSLSLTPLLLERVVCGLVLKEFFADWVFDGGHVQGELWETDGLRVNWYSR